MVAGRGKTQRNIDEGLPLPAVQTVPAEADELVTHHGHDRHFLSRLERVAWREADLALRLYHEPALVRGLLADASVPGAAERIALAIAPGQDPPHVLVTRQGRFITCLGPGMRIGELPVLAWERVQIHVERADRDASRLKLALSTLRALGGDLLGRKLVDSGARLTREDFQQLMAVEPLLHDKLLAEVAQTFGYLRKNMPLIARIKRPHHEVPLLRNYWNSFHYLGHLLLLTSYDGRRSFAHIENRTWKHNLFEYVYVPMLELGYGPVALRALWAIGRAGKLALPALKRMLQDQPTSMGWCFPALGLVSIAMRHQRLRAEALGAISVAHLPAPLREDALAHWFIDAFRRLTDTHPINGDQGPVMRLAAARVVAGTLLDGLDGRPAREQEVLREDESILPRLAQRPFDFIDDAQHMRTLLIGTVALAGRPAEEFYFPAEHVNEAPAFTPEAARALAEIARPGGPVKAEAKPGRNDPCSCGSGKKYKKCCGG